MDLQSAPSEAVRKMEHALATLKEVYGELDEDARPPEPAFKRALALASALFAHPGTALPLVYADGQAIVFGWSSSHLSIGSDGVSLSHAGRAVLVNTDGGAVEEILRLRVARRQL